MTEPQDERDAANALRWLIQKAERRRRRIRAGVIATAIMSAPFALGGLIWAGIRFDFLPILQLIFFGVLGLVLGTVVLAAIVAAWRGLFKAFGGEETHDR